MPARKKGTPSASRVGKEEEDDEDEEDEDEEDDEEEEEEDAGSAPRCAGSRIAKVPTEDLTASSQTSIRSVARHSPRSARRCSTPPTSACEKKAAPSALPSDETQPTTTARGSASTMRRAATAPQPACSSTMRLLPSRRTAKEMARASELPAIMRSSAARSSAPGACAGSAPPKSEAGRPPSGCAPAPPAGAASSSTSGCECERSTPATMAPSRETS